MTNYKMMGSNFGDLMNELTAPQLTPNHLYSYLQTLKTKEDIIKFLQDANVINDSLELILLK